MKIDHHLQLSMITRLVKSDTSLKYGELKDDSIENSLFSYHLNKLIDRGMILKADDGYSMSIDGARWLNDNGILMTEREVLRVYVALLVQNKSGEYLIAQRQGQFRAKINDYMLPSKRYTNNLDLTTQVQNVIDKVIPSHSLIDQKEYGFMQIKAAYRSGDTVRALFNITLCHTDTFNATPLNDLTEYEWLSLEAIQAIDHPSAEIIREILRYIEGEPGGHSTPIIVG